MSTVDGFLPSGNRGWVRRLLEQFERTFEKLFDDGSHRRTRTPMHRS